MQHSSHKIFIYTALPCEAKPLIDFSHLKKNIAIEPFAVFFNDDICLTVTGIGKSAMAAGIAYTQALFAAVPHPILLNIGIAGHEEHALGDLYLIDKITDADSQKNYYPPLLFKPPCPTANLLTVSRAQLSYNQQPHLYDMEASAFFETATRFSTGELVHCLKIISDNKETPAENIQAKTVSALIAAQLPAIESVMQNLDQLSLSIRTFEVAVFTELKQRYRFTASEQMQLKNKLSRLAVLTGRRSIDVDVDALHSAGEVLKWLDQQIGKTAFYL